MVSLINYLKLRLGQFDYVIRLSFHQVGSI
jgi:hypothetical protein